MDGKKATDGWGSALTSGTSAGPGLGSHRSHDAPDRPQKVPSPQSSGQIWLTSISCLASVVFCFVFLIVVKTRIV